MNLRKKTFITLLLAIFLASFSLFVSAKDISKFKVIVSFEEEIKIDNLCVGVAIIDEYIDYEKSEQLRTVDYDLYTFKGTTIEFERPSKAFILKLDEKDLPYGYCVADNYVIIDDDTNVYKFKIIKNNIDFVEESYNFSDNLCRLIIINDDSLFSNQVRNYSYVNSGRFFVYYDSQLTNGYNYASSVLYYVDDIETFISTYGFSAPQSNTSGDFYIYLEDNSTMGNANGITTANALGLSTIKLNLSLFGKTNDSNAFVATLAHEYLHASVAVNSFSMMGGWFGESAATAFGLYYVSNRNVESNYIRSQYNSRLESYYGHSQESIDNINNRYRNFIFIYYFIQEIGLDFIYDLFDLQLNHSLYISDLENVLLTMNTCVAEEFQTFCIFNLNPIDNYDVSSYYKSEWNYSTLECKPTNHNEFDSIYDDYFDCEQLSSFYISINPYEGNNGCSNYKSQMVLVLPDYRDVSVYLATITNTGNTYYEELNIPQVYSSIFGGYAVIFYTNNLGSATCKELRVVISSYEGREVIGRYNIKIKHKIPTIYESYSVTFGSILNDLRYLKFTPYDSGLYKFDISTNNGNTLTNEIVVRDDTFNDIYRIEVGNISYLASNNSNSNSFVCYLVEGEDYYIKVINDSSVSQHSLNINRLFDSFVPDVYNSFGVSNQYFSRGDKLYSFVVPQSGNYSFLFNLNNQVSRDVLFVVYREGNNGLIMESYDILNNNNQSSYCSFQLYQYDKVYVGYYNYKGYENKTYNIVVTKN